MAGRWVLALDAGGGGGGALVLELETGAHHIAHRRWTHTVAPGTGGWGYNFDTRAAWRLLMEAAREAIAASGCRPGEIAGIATTGMRHGTVVIAAGGRELFATPNRDARAAAEATELASSHGAEIYRRTGLWPAPLLPLARLRWLAREAPAVVDAAAAVLSVSDWLGFRLTGELKAEATQASASGMVELGEAGWAPGLVAHTGLPASLFPAIVQPGTQIGTLTAPAAASLGIAPGIPVFAGAADTQAALLGSGAVSAGALAAVAGTTMPVVGLAPQPTVDAAGRTWTGRHALEDSWLVESNAGPAGEALDLLAGMFFPGEQLAVARFAAEAAAVVPGAEGTFSDLGASVFNASELSLPVGGLGLSPLVLAKAASPRAVLARATLEGISFGVRANISQVEAVIGATASGIAVSGGLSRSDTWLSILASATGRQVTRAAIPQATLSGAAMCAAVGLGSFAGLTEASLSPGRPGRAFEPEQQQAAMYHEIFEEWTAWREARSGADERLAEGILARSEDDTEAPPVSIRTTIPERPRVLVTAPLDAVSLARLHESWEVRYEPFMESQRVLTDDDLVESLDGVALLVTEVDIVDAAVLDRSPSLRAVFTCRADPVNVDVAACTAHGVPVMNAPGRNATAVAEMTIASILSLLRHTVAADRFQRDPATAAGDIARMGMAHADFEGRELSGLTIGLVGFGAVGREVARRLLPSGAMVIAADPFADPVATLAAGVTVVPLDALLATADVISLHAPVNDTTRGMIGPAQFAAMKKGVLFVNTARAALVDEVALTSALESGAVGGTALDVFSEEPPGHGHPLLRFSNVIATPHIAGNTSGVAQAQGAMVCDALEALLDSRMPATVLNAETLAAFSWTGDRRAPTEAEREALAQGKGPAVTDLEREPVPARPTARPAHAALRAEPAAAAASTPAAARPRKTAPPPSRFGLPRGLREALGSVRIVREKPAAKVAAAGTAAGPAVPPEQWERLFTLFTERLPGDEAVRRFSDGKNVIVRYDVQDLGIVFYTAFADEPRAAMGEPPDPPHLTLRMTSAVLDDVFMERISGMKAAMSGKMAFSGNTRRAMTLQRVQKDLNRLYRGAREQVGLPEGPVGSAGATTSTAAAAPGTSAGAATDGEREEMIALVRELFASHLLTSTGGNVSVRREGLPEEAWITPSALPKGHLSAEMLVRIGMDGEPLDAGSLAPSSERLMHTAVYRARPDVGAIVHSHGPKGFALGLSGLPFLPVSTEAAFFGDLPRVPFTMPGTEELAEAAAAAMGSGNGVLLVNHGAIVAASSLRRAVDMTAVIEETSGALLDCHAAGKVPPVLPDEIVRELREVGEMIA